MHKIKLIFSIGLLITVIVWVATKGSIVKGLGLAPIAIASALTVALICVNAGILLRSVGLFNASLSYRYALLLSSGSGLVNSLGGIPVGTATKYVVLYQKTSLRKRDILFGQAYFSALNILFLFGIGVSALNYLWGAVYFVCCVAAALIFSKVMPEWLDRYTKRENLVPNALLSLLSVSLMVLSYLAICSGSELEIDTNKLVAFICLGLILGLSTGVPSLGGMQEIMMGISSQLLMGNMLHGVEFSLIIRIISIISSAPVFAGMVLYTKSLNKD